MAISAYSGLPGSGKSYSVFEYVIIPALKEGREVWCNIPCHKEKLETDFGLSPVLFDIADLKQNHNWFSEVLPKGVLLVIDECWDLWPQGLKANQVPDQHKEFIAKHRHLVGETGRSTEICLVTQDLADIATFARNKVDKTFRTTKLDLLGTPNRFRVDIYSGGMSGANPPVKKRIQEQFGSYKKEIYQYYISHTGSDTGQAGNETRSDNRFNIMGGRWLKWSISIILICLVFLYYGFNKVAEGYGFNDSDTDTPLLLPPPTGNQKPPQRPLKPRVFDLIKGSDVSISFNMGSFPDINYRFSVRDGNSTYSLGFQDFIDQGYEIKPLSNCLVLLFINSDTYKVTCASGSKKSALIDMNFANNSTEQPH